MQEYIDHQVIENVKFPKVLDPRSIEYAFRYEAKDDDKFVITYPKNGTTWTQQIMALIANDGVINDQNFTWKSYLEMSGPNTVRWPAIKTHLPFNALPLNPSAKYLLVVRNPKDSCVSFFHHTKKLHPEFEGDFHDYFQLWIGGDVPYGDYFEYTLEYWKHRSDPNFQFLIYEEMKRNPKEAVIRIANFLGEEFVDKLAKDETLLNKIIENSTIDTMKSGFEKSNPFFKFLTRKGEIGDWKHHMTEDESDLIDDKVVKIFGGTGLDMLWTDCMKW